MLSIHIVSKKVYLINLDKTSPLNEKTLFLGIISKKRQKPHFSFLIVVIRHIGKMGLGVCGDF